MQKKVFSIISVIVLLFGFVSITSAACVTQGVCPEGQICNPLNYCNFEDLINAVIYNFLIPVGTIVAGIMFVVAGIVFITSSGDPEKAKTARKIMIYTAVGLAVILAASGLIKILQELLRVPQT